MSQIDLTRLTERERKTYSEGLAIVSRKLEAARKADAGHRSEQADRSATQLVSRIGSRLAETCFGAKDTQAEKRFDAIVDAVVSKALASPVKAAPSMTPDPPVSSNPRSTFKRMSVSFGIEQNSRRLASIA